MSKQGALGKAAGCVTKRCALPANLLGYLWRENKHLAHSPELRSRDGSRSTAPGLPSSPPPSPVPPPGPVLRAVFAWASRASPCLPARPEVRMGPELPGEPAPSAGLRKEHSSHPHVGPLLTSAGGPISVCAPGGCGPEGYKGGLSFSSIILSSPGFCLTANSLLGSPTGWAQQLSRGVGCPGPWPRGAWERQLAAGPVVLPSLSPSLLQGTAPPASCGHTLGQLQLLQAAQPRAAGTDAVSDSLHTSHLATSQVS